MKDAVKILMLVVITCFNSIYALDVLLQSRIKGAMMGSALGDAFSRSIKKRRECGKGHKESISCFNDFSNADWVRDKEGFCIGLGTEQTVFFQNQFEAFVEARRRFYSLEDIFDYSVTRLSRILRQQNALVDPYYIFRGYREESLRKIDTIAECYTTLDFYLAKLPLLEESSPDANGLIFALPLGLVFLDNKRQALELADIQIQLIENNPETRISSLALCSGIIEALHDKPIEDIVHHMIATAELYESTLLQSSSKVSSLLREAYNKAQSESYVDIYYQGKNMLPSEIVAATVYCITKFREDFKGLLSYCVRAENNTVLATLAGALAGAKLGFWELKKQGYREDLEMLEKINVLQSTCNDLYVLLTDYPQYDYFQRRFSGLQS